MLTSTITVILWILATILVIAGLAGTILPILPGPLLLFFGLFLAAWIEGFAEVGLVPLVILGLMMVWAIVIDFLASAWGVKGFGASRKACWGALLGAIVGLFFGLPGILLGPFIGAFLGEISAHPSLARAGRAGLGAWLGFLVGSAAKVAIGLAMVGVFIVARCF
ncbi:DUF456 domain-containing protein [Planctomycetota bacterium]